MHASQVILSCCYTLNSVVPCIFDHIGYIRAVELYHLLWYWRNFSKLCVPGCSGSRLRRYTAKQACNLKLCSGKKWIGFTVHSITCMWLCLTQHCINNASARGSRVRLPILFPTNYVNFGGKFVEQFLLN